ncbi:MAG: universal stress protein [Desulfobacteraceae bacterium]
MNYRFLHIYRHTPLGRETLLQSIHFCKMLNLSLSIYIPESKRFLMCCGNESSGLQIELDKSYFVTPESALTHAKELTENEGTKPHWIIPQNDTVKNYPKIPGPFEFMCCPRCIKEPLSKLSVGYIDSMVRKIIRTAQFPVLIPSLAYRPWKRIAVFYRGSYSALNALKLGLQICRVSGLPLDIFTPLESGRNKNVQNSIKNQALKNEIDNAINKWHQFPSRDFMSNILNVSHDALVLLGGFHSQKHRNFSGKMEKIQSVLPNNLLVVGPNCSELVLEGPEAGIGPDSMAHAL